MTAAGVPMPASPLGARSDAVAEAEAMADTHLARQREVEQVGTLVRWMDDAVRVPGTRFGIGLDAAIGMLVPVVGDAITGLVALRVMVAAMRRGVPTVVLARMLLNIGVDVVVGMVPVVGDLFDLLWRSNVRNLELLERHQGELEPRARASDYAVVSGAAVAVATSIAMPLVALWWIFGLLFG